MNPKWQLSDHALFEMRRREVELEWVEQTLEDPEQIVPGYEGRIAYQRRFVFESGPLLLRVIVATDTEPPTVVTVYPTSRIRKYWRE